MIHWVNTVKNKSENTIFHTQLYSGKWFCMNLNINIGGHNLYVNIMHQAIDMDRVLCIQSWKWYLTSEEITIDKKQHQVFNCYMFDRP